MALALVAIAVGSCAAQPVEVEVKFDRPGRVEWVTGKTVEITWKEVDDSRCAEGATCVWEGEVTVTLAVAIDGEDEGDFEITLHEGDEDKARAQVGRFVIHLAGVTPFPVLDVETPRSEYAAQLVLTGSGADTAVQSSSWGMVKRAAASTGIGEAGH